jgi:hypothetical protein
LSFERSGSRDTSRAPAGAEPVAPWAPEAEPSEIRFRPAEGTLIDPPENSKNIEKHAVKWLRRAGNDDKNSRSH